MIRALILAVLAAVTVDLHAGEIGCVYQVGHNAEIRKGSAGTEWQPVKKSMPFAEGDRIKTGRGGYCEILARDGTFIKMDENSELAASDLQLDPAGRKYSFSFLMGKATWLVARLKAGLASKVEVRTLQAVCAVRGTAFTVVASSDNASVGLFEGNLDVDAGSGARELKEGNQADVSGSTLTVQSRLSRSMEAEKRRYQKLKNRVEALRKKLKEREDFIDSYLAEQDRKISDYEKRKAEKLGKRSK